MLRLQQHCSELSSVLSDALGLRLVGDPDGGDAAGDGAAAAVLPPLHPYHHLLHPHEHPLLSGAGGLAPPRPWLESAFKSSAAKKDGPRRYVATNLHVQVRAGSKSAFS